MLRLVLGRSGSGKTRRALELAGEAGKAGREVILLVPEQFTFEAEKLLLCTLGAPAQLSIETLSFTRLAQRVFRECGGLARRYIDDCGRMIVMRMALRETSDRLEVYRRQAESPAFLRTMVDAAAEYKAFGVTPVLLTETAGKIGDGLLGRKLRDLSLVLAAYDALLGEKLADENDDLPRLCRALDSHPFFRGKTVIVDSFKGFTPQERAVLRRVVAQADETVVTLCADGFDDPEHGLGLFSPVRLTARQLVSEAAKAGAKTAAPVLLGEPKRFEEEDLRELERRVFRPGAGAFPGKADHVHIVSASNIYDEARFAAQTIAALVRETGCRYRDFVVIAGEPELYHGVIDPAFAKYGVPLFLDFRRSVDTHPLMALCLSLFEAALGNFRAGPVFRALKTGLLDFSVEEIALLENYVLVWDIKGADRWSAEWTNHPDGFGRAFSDADRAMLSQINGIRRRVWEPLSAFKRGLDQNTESGGFCRLLYAALQSCGVDKKLPDICEELRRGGEAELADEYLRMWDTLMGLLDQLALTLGGFPVAAKEFYGLLRLGIAGCDIGHIPSTLDCVTFGDAERIRAGEAKYVFVLGLAEGIFPKGAGSGGIFSQAERRRLAEAGVELAPGSEERAAEERFFAYKAFTCASRGVWLCCPRSDTAGRAQRPSQFLAAVRAALPGCDVKEEALGDLLGAVQNERTAYEALARGISRADVLSASLRAVFSKKSEYAARLDSLRRVSEKREFAFRDPAAARALYGENIVLTPSRLETHRECRFAYFCRYGLGALPRRKAELAAPEIGTLIHFVLERLLPRLRGKDRPDEAGLRAAATALLDEYARDYLGGLDDKPERFRFLYMQLGDTVTELVGHLARELGQSAFEPVDFELSIAPDGEISPVVLPLEDGGKLLVCGRVDRVDLMKKGGRTFLRVVDYKTGAKKFCLSDVLYGLNLQMLIYLFTLCENGAGRYGGAPVPAGVLYFPAKRPDPQAPRGITAEELGGLVNGGLKMNGLVNGDPEIVFGMEKDGAGIFIPVRMKKTSSPEAPEWDAASSVASLEQLGQIRRRIGKTLLDMAKTLRRGDIAALPVSGRDYDPCKYCDYGAVCGREPADPAEQLRNFPDGEVWKRLGGDAAETVRP